jgi:LmbE family N-acetylglucosaminyl deacetylase
MIGFAGFSGLKRLLCLGAHSDDIGIGAGATVLRIIRENPDVFITWCALRPQNISRTKSRVT